jgi:hypothetical protein
MGQQTPISGLSLPADPQTSTALNRESVRSRVAAHLAAKLPVEELDIAPDRPADTQDFAFVGITPKRSSRASWYRCSFCQRPFQFSAGRIVLSSDGRLRLIGDDCWNTHLDKDRYDEEAKDFRHYNTRQRFEAMRGRLHPAIGKAAQTLRQSIGQWEAEFRFVEQLPAQLEGIASVVR